jgi:hypothetical protein
MSNPATQPLRDYIRTFFNSLIDPLNNAMAVVQCKLELLEKKMSINVEEFKEYLNEYKEITQHIKDNELYVEQQMKILFSKLESGVQKK